MNAFQIFLLWLMSLLLLSIPTLSQKASLIVHKKEKKIVILSDARKSLIVQVDYSNRCELNKLMIMGNEVLGERNAAYSGVVLEDELFSSKHCISSPILTINKNIVKINNIKYGNKSFLISEEWIFLVNGIDIQWQINRHYLNDGIVKENKFPCWQFNSMQTWNGCMGDKNMSKKYQQLASKLKAAFNRNASNGGFWDPDKNLYVYWHEKNGSVYGDNLVSMINFLAIGYGLCDDPGRKDVVLNKIEDLMQKEELFIWPSCFFPYQDSLGLKNVNYPYPNYENGDLFLAWAELGTRCYADKHPEIALKYIKNVISQYELDGLAHQRYTRIKQTGVGDDILSNNIMAVVGLYRNIYGVRPRYNRLYLEPHLTDELNGTQLKYCLRNEDYLISLSKGKYSIAVKKFSVSNQYPFGIDYHANGLNYFNGENKDVSLKIRSEGFCAINILSWEKDYKSWQQAVENPRTDKIGYEVHDLDIDQEYELFINDNRIKKCTSDLTGMIMFNCPAGKRNIKIKTVKTDN